MRVAVIGAGCSGLTAIKCCLDEGLEPVCFERSNDIGGLWRYSDKVTEGQASVMKSTVINTSKEMMCYSDFPIPEEYPFFMHNTYVQKYFNLYAEKFSLKKHVQFETEVLMVSKYSDYDETGRWTIKTKDMKTEKVTDHVFDAVMICTGHHAEKNMPSFPGLSNFKGKVLHSHDYRKPEGFEGKNVLVIGIGNSGGDVATELSRFASKVYLSTRRGSWIINTVNQNGMPIDMVHGTRKNKMVKNTLPESVFNRIFENALNARFDHVAYSLKPKHHATAQHPTLNDDMPKRLANGMLKIKPDVKEFTVTGVIFEDNTRDDNIDFVCMATGYIFGFPFLDKSIIDVKNNNVELFKYVFPPKLENHTLCVIGCIQPLGAIMPISELQSRLATRVFQGKVHLPSCKEMMTDIQSKITEMKERYVQTQRHTIQVDYIEYMDELAELNGCLPNLRKMFLTDIKLAMTCFFGPCTPYQYRLIGPGKWDGAREAILTQWDRTLKPLKTRPVPLDQSTNYFVFYLFFVVGALLAIVMYNISMC